MGVSAEYLGTKDTYNISYDKSLCEGDLITAQFENQADGDKSTYKGANDGSFVVHVDEGYEGTDTVNIQGSSGGPGDGGEVVFG